ncbi:MAG: hypothetical protein ABI651_06985 [Verrucomicrobiota bacterium]
MKTIKNLTCVSAMKTINKSLDPHTLTAAPRFAAALAMLGLIILTTASSLERAQASESRSHENVEMIKVDEGQLLYEIIGQVINLTPTTSTQFGYYTYIKGVDGLFAGTPENESTAWFTFHRETTNLRVTVNGPLRIISREGTTTVYLNAAPVGNFSDPDSFRVGTPIQISTLRQQVIVDTVTQAFTVVNQDTITSTSRFSVNGTTYQIGKAGDVFRTTKNGHLSGPVPSGYFAGYSVGAEKSK